MRVTVWLCPDWQKEILTFKLNTMTKKKIKTKETDNTANLGIGVVMPRCLTCNHWRQTSFYEYEGVVNDGECDELKVELDIQLKTGWEGGYVDVIETKQTFGCPLHNGA